MIKKNPFLFLLFLYSNLASARDLHTQTRPHGKSPEAICGKLSFDLKERGQLFLQLRHAKDREEEIFLQEKTTRNSREITKNLTERIISAAYGENIKNETKAKKELLLFQNELIRNDLFRKLIENYDILDHEQRESVVRIFFSLKNFPSNKFTTPTGILKIEKKLLQLFREKTTHKYQVCEILTSLIVIESDLKNIKEFLEVLLSLSQSLDASVSFSCLKSLEHIFSSPLVKHHFLPPTKKNKRDERQRKNYLWLLQFIKKMFSSDKRKIIPMTSYLKTFNNFLTQKSNRPFLLKYTGDKHDFLRFLEIFEEKNLNLKREAYYMVALFLINPREDRSAELISLIRKNHQRIKKSLEDYIETIEKTKGQPEKKKKL